MQHVSTSTRPLTATVEDLLMARARRDEQDRQTLRRLRKMRSA